MKRINFCLLKFLKPFAVAKTNIYLINQNFNNFFHCDLSILFGRVKKIKDLG